MTNHTIAAKAAVLTSEPRAPSRHITDHLLLTGLVGDALVVFLALAFSSWLRFQTSLAHVGVDASSIYWTEYFGHVMFGAGLFLLLLPHREIYDLHRIFRFRRIGLAIVRTGLIWLVAYMALSGLLRYGREISRLYVFIAFGITTSALVVWRFLLSQFVSEEAVAQRLRQRILFVGWSAAARSLAQAILNDARHPYEIVGYVPAPRAPEPGVPPVFVRKLADFDSMAEVLASHEVDIVIHADLNASTQETMTLADLCEKEMVDFKVIAGCFPVLRSCLRLQTVSGVPVLGVTYFPLENPFNVAIKQLIDLVGGLVGLGLSAPIVAVFAALVYRESPGPVIYRQRRLGRHGRPFWIYKIRSMRADAERDGTVGWTVKGDPRRLRIGSFMRRWNIDELPQFWNVLKGDMSLVGPRPERPELISVFKEEISHYNARHNVKPGITGWAQVNGFRGDTDLNERIRCDLHYIENWSPLLDLQIVGMTLFRHKNAA